MRGAGGERGTHSKYVGGMLGEAIRDPDKTGQAESGAGKAPTKKHILCNTEDLSLPIAAWGPRATSRTRPDRRQERDSMGQHGLSDSVGGPAQAGDPAAVAAMAATMGEVTLGNTRNN